VLLTVDIKKDMGDFKLDVTFKAQDKIMSILGASGCGKSITLKCIAGIETPDEGKIMLGDRVLFDSENKISLPPQKRKVGYLFQNYCLFPNMTVRENIAAGIKLPKDKRSKIVDEKIKTFRLEGLENKRPAQLSGGQQQRVALARILASDPEIIMLDEPFSALDSNLKWLLEQELMDLLSTFQGQVLFVSHNRNEVYRFSDTIAVINDGKIDVINSKEELFDNPTTMSAALLTGCKNISRALKISEHSINALDWGVTLHTRRVVPDNIKHIGMRAHYIKYAEKEETINTITCSVIKVIENPFSYIIMLRNIYSTDTSNLSSIRWETDKSHWENIHNNTINLFFDEDSLLFIS
jgi:molybdate transport system ATP-binding protein